MRKNYGTATEGVKGGFAADDMDARDVRSAGELVGRWDEDGADVFCPDAGKGNWQRSPAMQQRRRAHEMIADVEIDAAFGSAGGAYVGSQGNPFVSQREQCGGGEAHG